MPGCSSADLDVSRTGTRSASTSASHCALAHASRAGGHSAVTGCCLCAYSRYVVYGGQCLRKGRPLVTPGRVSCPAERTSVGLIVCKPPPAVLATCLLSISALHAVLWGDSCCTTRRWCEFRVTLLRPAGRGGHSRSTQRLYIEREVLENGFLVSVYRRKDKDCLITV